MYNYNLKITIFSKVKELESVAKSIIPLPNYTHNINRLEDFSRILLQLSEI